MRYNFDKIGLFVVLCTSVGIRGIVSLSSYSGASTPPMFGDYEAQRHWQEIAYNLPVNEWYSNTTDNDLLYWGIDYPPLSAYHSYVLGSIARRLNSSYVQLFYSRGIESARHKSFMRLTVLSADLFIYIPATIMVIISLETISSTFFLPSLTLLLFYPCQILVDNGHFQYNNISLGLFLFSVASILQNRCNWACFAFSLALNYKQMELYHAVPIFVYLLGISLSGKLTFKNIFNILQIGFITATTFILLWIPWTSSLDSLKSTVLRLFPLKRGVFEDKVANVWCSLNVIYKFKEKLENYKMALICLVATLLAITPTNFHLFLDTKKRNLLLSLVNTSLSFFLFSFQVHEKSILLAATPICLIFKTMPFSVICFLKVSTFSIFPLLMRDNLCIIYFCMILSYSIIFKHLIQLINDKNKKNNRRLIRYMDLLDVIILNTSIATLFLPSPEGLPYLWPSAISILCCIFFIIFLLELNLFQYHRYVITLTTLRKLH